MLQAIYGGIRTEEGWRRRRNQELEELYENQNIIAVVKKLSGERLPKLVLTRKLIEKKKGQKNKVEPNLKLMKIKLERENNKQKRMKRDGVRNTQKKSAKIRSEI